MTKQYHLAVFDWEGTLGDTLGQILNTVATEAKRLRFGDVDECIARRYVSLGLVVAVQKIFPGLSLQQYEELLHAVQLSLTSRSVDVCLIPGAKNILQQMQQAGITLAIATNKGRQSLQRALEISKLDKFFTVTRSAGQTPAKPCPQMLTEIMEVCGVSAKHTLMIGDSLADIEMAAAVNVDAVGVNFYHQQDQKEELSMAGAIAVFDDYQALADYLELSDLKK